MFITHQIFFFKIRTNFSMMKKPIIREIKNSVKGTYTDNREILDTLN